MSLPSSEELKFMAEAARLLESQKKSVAQQIDENVLAGVKSLFDTYGVGGVEFLMRAIELQKTMQPKTGFELAMECLKTNVATMPKGFEFEIPQVIGADVWASLDRNSKLALGKHVKASQETYGLQFLHKSVSNHAIYKRADS